MSYFSDSSSGSSKTRKGGEDCVGIPKKCCLCDAGIVTYMSHSNANPNRMFFRCATAASLKLSGDNHTFKWVDKAVDEEVVEKAPLFERLQREVCEVRSDVLELQKQFDEYKKTVKIIAVGCLFVAVVYKFI